MTLPLTVETLEAAYEYLCTTPPFNRWNLPAGEDVKFSVSRHKRREYGRYQWNGEQHVVSMSHHAIGHSGTLLEKLSHEMIHMHLEETKMESRTGDRDTHNLAFRRKAAQVCKAHGFDLKAFY